MSQAELYQFLKKHKGEWFDTKQIKQAINATAATTTRCMNKLNSYDDIIIKREIVRNTKTAKIFIQHK